MGYLDIADYQLTEEKIRLLHPLKLAFVGDAIFENYIRTYLVLTKQLSTHKIAMESSKYVRAVAQNVIVRTLKPSLTQEEWEIVIRARNQSPKTIPKNASVGEYRYATGFEALIGYLALSGRDARLDEIIKESIRIAEKEEGV
ncbi:MAG: ribonuclease III domain-containing protein [Bacillota bacterium]|nr:ribonuclease III domain-containing protein [Bacillota bacterium]